MTESEASYQQSQEPTVDFDWSAIENQQALTALGVLTELLAWAGSNRLRLTLIPHLLGQCQRTQKAIADELRCSQQAVAKTKVQGTKVLRQVVSRTRMNTGSDGVCGSKNAPHL